MTDRAQFEAMLNALINEDEAAAKEIFHNIVVAKSREIYEELLESDFGREEEEEEEEEEEGSDDSDNDDIGGDASDDFISDIDDDETDADSDDDEELEDRVMDLEDALEELKAEFDSLMADEANEPEHNDGEDDPDFGDEDGDEDEFGSELGDDDQEVKEIHHYHHDGDKQMPQDEFEAFMEYVNKVALPTHGDNGLNTKSVIDNMKNDMGGTTANILRGDTSLSGGTNGGLSNPSTDDLTKGLGTIQNRPDSKAGKTAFTKREPGHGPEKKGSSEKADNTSSIIGRKVR